MTRKERALRNLKQMCSDGRYLGGGSYVPLEVLEDFEVAIKALEQEPTTKNDLGVDCISRAQVQTEIELNASRYTIAKERGGMGQVEWSDQLIKISDAVNIIRELPSVTPQEPKSFQWCHDCKEYDQEKHCCHRWSKVIRNTIEEMKQEQEPRWIPVSKELPQDGERLIDDDVLVSCEDGEVRIGFCMGEDENGNREWAVGDKVFSEPVAWMPLPEPYQAESEEKNEHI